MLAISLTIACSRYTYDGVILHAHTVPGESHKQRNTTSSQPVGGMAASIVCRSLKFLELCVSTFCVTSAKPKLEHIFVKFTLPDYNSYLFFPSFNQHYCRKMPTPEKLRTAQ